MKAKFFFLLIIVSHYFSGNLFAFTKESGVLANTVNAIINSMPDEGENNYVPLGTPVLNAWEVMLKDLINGNINGASTGANALGYELVEFTDTPSNALYYLLRTKVGSTNYWGTYVMHSNPCRPNLIIQSPHPLHDVNTGQQGLYVFQKIDARFFMMSGTHRCNSSSFSSCDGTTKECSPTNSSEAYRISDMAHVVNSIFHISTKVLIQKTTDPYFIQLHGFSHSTGNPYIIMSNGTFVTPTNDKFPAIEASILAQDGTLNASNICIVHIDKPTSGKCSELKAFSNTQGRLINNSSDPCDKDATSTTGRFIHIEQEKTKFRDTQAGWDKIANALANVFAASNASSVTTNPVGNGLYGAGSALSSSGVIPLGNVVTFKAGSSITLTTGFHVLSGATLSVVLGGYGCFPP